MMTSHLVLPVFGLRTAFRGLALCRLGRSFRLHGPGVGFLVEDLHSEALPQEVAERPQVGGGVFKPGESGV